LPGCMSRFFVIDVPAGWSAAEMLDTGVCSLAALECRLAAPVRRLPRSKKPGRL
jgi:hypothetical protein